jgi:hypothetical protein
MRVFPTLEVIATETPGHLAKRIDPETRMPSSTWGVTDR